MNWSELFGAHQQPSFEEVKKFIGQGEPLWSELLSHIDCKYKARPRMSYSKCSAQPGWNVKLQKSGRSLCTLYPMPGYFIALVVIGAKEEKEFEMAFSGFTPHVQSLYRKASSACGGRWLMIEARDKSVVDDIKALVELRRNPKKAAQLD
jgi:hypothetical protein